MNAYFYPLTILLFDRIISNKSKWYSCGLGAKREGCSYWAIGRTWEAEHGLRAIRLRFELEKQCMQVFGTNFPMFLHPMKIGSPPLSSSTQWPGQYVWYLKPQRNLAVAPWSDCLLIFSCLIGFLNFHVCLFQSMQMTADRSPACHGFCVFMLSSCLP